MKLRQAILDAERSIAAEGSDEARLEAELILGYALGLNRAHLYQRLEEEIDSGGHRRFRRLLGRRLGHEPTAYILGHKEFFGLDFEVSPVALIPRPETETLVELVIAFAHERYGKSPVTIADIGCGCGIIAVSLAHALPFAQLIATDINPAALELTNRNAVRHDVSDRIQLALGDLLKPLQEPVAIIAANLPYVPTADWEACPRRSVTMSPAQGLMAARMGCGLSFGFSSRHLRTFAWEAHSSKRSEMSTGNWPNMRHVGSFPRRVSLSRRI